MASSTAKKKNTTTKRSSSAGKKTASSAKTVKSGTRQRTGTKNTVQKNARTKKNSARQREYVDYTIQIEIFLWIVIAAAVFFLISMFGLGGRLGAIIAGILGGCFGMMGYVFPVALLFMTAFLIANTHSYIARVKTAGGLLLFVDLCAMLQLGLVGYSSGYTAAQYYEAGQLYRIGGGAVGGILVSFFAQGIGTAGTWLLLVIFAVISLILMTQRSLIRAARRAGRRAAANARENRELRAEQRQAYRLQREQERAQAGKQEKESYDSDTLENFSLSENTARRTRTVSGVTGNTRINRTQEKSFFPELTASLPVSDDADTIPAETLTGAEPDAMSRIRGSVQKARRSKAPTKKSARSENVDISAPAQPKTEVQTVTPSQPLPDELFKNAFKKSDKQQQAASELEENAAADSLSASSLQSEESEDVNVSDVSPADTVQAAPDTAASRAPRKVHASQEEVQSGIDSVNAQIAQQESEPKQVYVYPDVSLLQKPSGGSGQTTEAELRDTAAKLQKVFETFHVNVRITDVTCGPSVTRYELMPELGVKVAKIVNLQDDIKLNLAAQDIRIEAPIPGKAAVGIEVPNKKPTGVMLRELLESEEYRNHKSKLAYVVGKDIAGNIIVSDIAKMPHLLIAGATGSGKSVFIHTLIMSLLYRAAPDEVKLIMIDPKVVELSVYNGIPHLFIPVVTDPKKAAGALNWAVSEMMNRYQKFAESGVRDLKGYNKRIEQLGDDIDEEQKPEKLPQIVIIVDELADLMMVASADVEDAICRLAQLARAAGIHLVIATQRPSVDVITGLIKANMPSRIALSVSSGVDSRTVLDQVGAEKLLGNGDMLFAPQQYKQPLRVQGAFISDNEVAAVTGFLKEHNQSEVYDRQMQERMESVSKTTSAAGGDSDTDELFAQAGKFIIEKDKASIGMLQRWFKIGFNRAARIMDQLSDAGVVGPEEGTKPRKVLMSEEQFENYLEQN